MSETVSNRIILDEVQTEEKFDGQLRETNVKFQPDEEHGLTIFGGVLSIISTILGGGVVALPWSFYMLGIYPALIMMVIMAGLTINSSVLYLKAKDLTPGKPESLYELGYILMKRASIFTISGILTLNGLGMCMIYFMIFGNTIGSIVAGISGEQKQIDTFITGDTFVYQRTMYIMILAMALLPIIVKKELQELHIVSMGLFASILLFIFILFVQLCIFGTYKFDKMIDSDGILQDTHLTLDQIKFPPADSTIYNKISGIGMMMVAFCFALNLFPIFSALKVKTNQNMTVTTTLGIGLTFVIYSLLSLICVFMFGSSVGIKSDLMTQVNTEYALYPKRWESFVLQFLFCVVLACHIPFIFFSGKESLCIIIDELDRKSISKTLDERIKVLQKSVQNKKILGGVRSHKSFEKADEKTRKSSYANESGIVDTEMNKELLKAADQETHQSIKSKPSERESGIRNGSHQSNLRYTLQGNSKSRQASVGSEVNIGKVTRVSRITIVRETQALRKTVQLGDRDVLRNSNVNPSAKNSFSGEQEEGLAYKDMKSAYYYGATIIYFGLVVAGAILVEEVEAIFNFISAVSGSTLAFIFPSVFYILSNRKYPENRDQRKSLAKLNIIQGNPDSNQPLLFSAYLQLMLGTIAFIVMMFNSINSIVLSSKTAEK